LVLPTSEIFSSVEFQTQVSTLICDSKQLKKLPAVSSKLQSLKHVIYIEDEPVEADTLNLLKHLTTSSFTEVEELGKTSHIDARLPSSTDTAVIMYTSGSTGLPKVRFCLRYFTSFCIHSSIA
jgi:long-chain acyl-CoA synthetase